MQATTQTEPAIIEIDVLRLERDEGPFLRGTFNQPPALVRVRRDTYVQWQFGNAREGDTFIVSFTNGSPFAGVSALSDRTPPLPAVHKGSFHYQVFVVDGTSGEVHFIHHCPEIEVVGGDSN